MSVFSENMAAVSDSLDYLFGDAVTITPKGGSAAAVDGRLGPERVDEEVAEARRGRYVSRTFTFDPANGPTAAFIDGTVKLADATEYRIEAVQARSASMVVLKLSRRVAGEISGPEHRIRR